MLATIPCLTFGSGTATRLFEVLIPWLLLAIVVGTGIVLRRHLHVTERTRAAGRSEDLAVELGTESEHH
jgi:hypothetical protein